MPTLSDVFAKKDYRVTKTIVAIDLKNSTSMKSFEPETTWLNHYAVFFDLLRSKVKSFNGQIVKYLGDGAMAIFDSEHPEGAINWAISVQEDLVDAQEANLIMAKCDCSIGVSYGEMVEFDTFDLDTGPKDYIGAVVDKAFRLCSAANAKAIFVDKDTIFAAPMHKVESKIGKITRRKPPEYQGEEQSVTVKGFPVPVPYHEILWAGDRYGVSAPFVTELSAEKSETTPTGAAVAETRSGKVGGGGLWTSKSATVSSSAGRGPAWVRGVVYSASDKYGFIRGSDGEEFWFSRDYLFRKTLPLQENDVVWFVAKPPFGDKPHRRATDILPLGAVLDGNLIEVKDKGFGFVVCRADRGSTVELFIHLGETSGWTTGALIKFKIGENKRGLSATSPQRV